MKVSILIPSYGDVRWTDLAAKARASALDQGAREVITRHQTAGTISSVRNALAVEAEGEWLCFLDADDELAPGYVEAMARAISTADAVMAPERCLFTPAIQYVDRGRRRPPMFWPECPLSSANWIVIGTLVHRDLFFEVGGFEDWGDPPGSNAYEDWALWSRCVQAGATIVKVPEAIYIADRISGSRHRGFNHTVRAGWHYEIGKAIWDYPESWLAQNGRPARRARTRR